MRILVTGANGFLGRRLCASASGEHEVYGLVRRPISNLSHAAIVADLTTDFDTSDWPTVDAVVHLAQSSRYSEFPTAAEEVFAVAASASSKLLAYAVRCGAKRFVFASTGGIYAPKRSPIQETDPVELSGNLAHYFASKKAGELLCQAYARHIDTHVARIFFCFGPAQRPPLLMPRLADQISQRVPIALNGEGTMMNPVYIDDAVSALSELVKSGGPGIVNIAGPRAVTLREVCEAIGDGLAIGVEYVVNQDVPAAYLVADTDLMARQLWKPRCDPLEALKYCASSMVGMQAGSGPPGDGT